jgi:selenocysteine lyase/cysteine desulfurase
LGAQKQLIMSANTDNYRAFASITDEKEVPSENSVPAKIQNTLEVLRNDVVGSYQKFTSPYGEKPIIYTDWTASGRPVQRVEQYIQNEVMPFYGNTHTAASVTGHQSTCFRHEARQIVAESVNAKVTGKAAEDVVIFTGNGTTAAVSKLVDALGLNTLLPAGADESAKPVVFVSSYEHHSNLLPWRESVADVITIGYSTKTGVDLQELEEQLQLHAHRVLRVGAFSACSNVTGVCTAMDEVSILLHRYHALAVFDYATAAPYVKIDMNPVLPGNMNAALAYKDAIFFSGHKFLGGPGCPGVLIAKRKLMPQSHETPSSASVGGGTVFYVTEEHHRYLSNREEREEGGTPYVLGDVKLGLVMHVKKSIRVAWVEQEEHRIAQMVQEKLQRHPAVVLLGKPSSTSHHASNAPFLPIFSFLLRCGDRFLHFHFVAALLNDLFGIQCRGGCMCAGPFSQTLLGISDAHNAAFEQALLNRHEVLRPGYTRVSFPYWMHPSEIDYVIDAIHFVASHGHKFLPSYRYNHMTGEWAHTTRLTRFPERVWLSRFSLDVPSAYEPAAGESPPRTADAALREWGAPSVEALLQQVNNAASEELQRIEQQMKKVREKGSAALIAQNASSAAAAGESLHAVEYLRWFVTSEEALAMHRSGDGSNALSPLAGPIQPADLWQAEPPSPAKAGVTGQGAADLKVTPFAMHRDKKFLARTGSEAVAPRYMTLLGKNLVAASATLAAETISGKIRAAAAIEPSLQDSLTTSASTTPHPSEKTSTAATTPRLSEKVLSEAGSEKSDAAFTCETGTCSMRPRAAADGISADTPTGNDSLCSASFRLKSLTTPIHTHICR